LIKMTVRAMRGGKYEYICVFATLYSIYGKLKLRPEKRFSVP